MTIKFAIPSFITTLGMLFMARSLTVVISGGFPPLLPPRAELAVHAVCRARRAVPHVLHLVRRRSRCSPRVHAVAHQFRQLDQVDRRLPSTAAASMGIPVNRVKIICFMLCSMLAGFAGLIQVLRLELAAALDRRWAWSCRRWPPR